MNKYENKISSDVKQEQKDEEIKIDDIVWWIQTVVVAFVVIFIVPAFVFSFVCFVGILPHELYFVKYLSQDELSKMHTNKLHFEKNAVSLFKGII